ncbi:hypothetical protein [Metabacillus sp. 84]|uniref:hypothetical protein n=1 Tax=unclassified Metabacillus TaxID=2675274 RepID=UPI003CEBFB1A
MIDPIIYDADTLEGSSYVEIKPGRSAGRHWNKASIYLTDETFTFLAPAIVKHHKNYSLFGISRIDRETWKKILTELDKVKQALVDKPGAENLKDLIGFLILEETEKNFRKNPDQNCGDLIRLIAEFQTWVENKTKDHDYLTILGI